MYHLLSDTRREWVGPRPWAFTGLAAFWELRLHYRSAEPSRTMVASARRVFVADLLYEGLEQGGYRDIDEANVEMRRQQ
jgi:hypothetical protein